MGYFSTKEENVVLEGVERRTGRVTLTTRWMGVGRMGHRLWE